MRFAACTTSRVDGVTRAGGLLAALLLAASAAASAGDEPAARCEPVPEGQPRELRSGLCVRSTIDVDDPRAERIPYEEWRLPLAVGEAVQIEMDSPGPPATAAAPQSPDAAGLGREFDTYLQLRLAGAVVAQNDDRPGSRNSRIVFTARVAGDYVVRARPHLTGDGDYVLRVASPPPVTTLVAGRNLLPPLDRAPASGPFEERHFAFEGRPRERIRLELERRGFGDQLHLADPDDERLAVVGELDSDLSVVAIVPRSGTYRVLVRAHRFAGAERPAALIFERWPDIAPRPPRPLRIGAAVEGELGLLSPTATDPDGSLLFGELYAVRVGAREAVTAVVESSQFNPRLDAGTMSALGFASAIGIGEGGGAARLALRPDQSGTIVLRVSALDRGGGRYRIRIDRGASGDQSSP